MKRLVLLVGCICLLAPHALATNEFSKEWKDHYLTPNAPAALTPAARKAGCNVCHIKGEKKTEHNEYGMAAKEFLDKEKLTKEWVQANPEKAKELIVEGLKKAGEKESKDGKKFAQKLADGELPATDAGL
jgi:hypothetical protein